MAEQSEESTEQGGVVARARGAFTAIRRRSRLIDHLVATLQHYGEVKGSLLAGAATYFGFLSFFPLLALAFAVVGYVARDFPNAQRNLINAIHQVFPGIITMHGQGNTISIDQIKSAKTTAGLIGFVGLLYSGLGWVSGLRKALLSTFGIASKSGYNFVVGKAVDLVVLISLGVVLMVSVGITGVIKGLAHRVLSWAGLAHSWIGTPLIWTIGVGFGIAASALLFYIMYRVLGAPDLPRRALWQGAILAAAGFEVLKEIVVNVLGQLGGSAFAPLAIAITLVIWINYFSRLVVYGASWAVTAPLTNPLRVGQEQRAEDSAYAASAAAPEGDPEPAGTLAHRFDLGSAIAGAAAAAVALLVIRRPD